MLSYFLPLRCPFNDLKSYLETWNEVGIEAQMGSISRKVQLCNC